MNQARAGLALMILGGVLVVVAGVGWAMTAGGGSEPGLAAPTLLETVTIPPATTPTTTTTVAVTTTTSQVVESTTSLPPETTPPSGSELVAGFVPVFAQAIADGDLEYVLSRLHPDIVEAFGDDLCRNWVQRDILALGDYQLDGTVEGPSTGSISTPSGILTFANRFSAPVTFTFSGRAYSVNADFVVVSGEVFFVGTCR